MTSHMGYDDDAYVDYLEQLIEKFGEGD